MYTLVWLGRGPYTLVWLGRGPYTTASVIYNWPCGPQETVSTKTTCVIHNHQHTYPSLHTSVGGLMTVHTHRVPLRSICAVDVPSLLTALHTNTPVHSSVKLVIIKTPLMSLAQ